MIKRDIGRSDISAAPVALGTWAMGGGPWWGETDDAESIRTIHAAIDSGITLLDTAPVYGFGRSETIVGKAIHDRRDTVVLATKCGLWWTDDRGSEFFSQDGHDVTRCLRPETIRSEVEESLRRLRTDYVDLYQTHWQAVDPDKTPIEDTMAELHRLKDQGKIRLIGVSNATVSDMAAYEQAGDLSTCQPRYSMLDRTIEEEILPFCAERSISTLVYSPLEQGLLTGKIGMDYTLSDSEFRNTIPWFIPKNRRRVLDVLENWQDLCDVYECSVAQLVIAWTISQPGVTFALCGARKADNVIENAKANDLNLNENDLLRMRTDVESLGTPIESS